VIWAVKLLQTMARMFKFQRQRKVNMSSGHLDSDSALQNSRCWQDICTFDSK